MSVGIVVIAVVSLVVSFCGYRVLHTLERWACEPSLQFLSVPRLILTGTGIPIVFAFIMLAGIGGRHLGAANDFAAAPATAGSVLTFISIIIGFTSTSHACNPKCPANNEFHKQSATAAWQVSLCKRRHRGRWS